MRQTKHYALLLAGFGVGIAAGVFCVSEAGGKTIGRVRDLASRAGGAFKARAGSLRDIAGDVRDRSERTLRNVRKEGNHTMNDLKDKAKDKIDSAADTAKKATDKAADKAKDMAHQIGKKIEEGGKRLQDA